MATLTRPLRSPEVLTLLTKLLGPYIADLSREKLRVGVWSGNVVLMDLQLREEVLDALGLPVRLQRGTIGRLQIRVPCSRLRSESVRLPQPPTPSAQVYTPHSSPSPVPAAHQNRWRFRSRT